MSCINICISIMARKILASTWEFDQEDISGQSDMGVQQ